MLLIFTVIKLVSTGLITSAIGLELYEISAFLRGIEVINLLNPIILIARAALIIHLIEGMIAGYKTLSFRHGIYTFFVGTVGLFELFENGKTGNV